MNFLDRIEINPKKMSGKPVIKGTRITIELILHNLFQKRSFEEILHSYPRLKEEDIEAAILFAEKQVQKSSAKNELSLAG